MQPVREVSGTVCPIDATDVDTDQIIPKQFLKRIERSGFGPFAFYEWRYRDAEGTDPDPDFAMNRPEHQGATILLAGPNFGCGSSREHAPWALEDAGFDAIIAPSFADIFRTNCAKIGLLCVELNGDEVRALFDAVADDPALEVTVDLEGQTATASDGFTAAFDIDQHTRHCLLEGLDDIALTLAQADAIDAYEAQRPTHRPRIPA